MVIRGLSREPGGSHRGSPDRPQPHFSISESVGSSSETHPPPARLPQLHSCTPGPSCHRPPSWASPQRDSSRTAVGQDLTHPNPTTSVRLPRLPIFAWSPPVLLPVCPRPSPPPQRGVFKLKNEPPAVGRVRTRQEQVPGPARCWICWAARGPGCPALSREGGLQRGQHHPLLWPRVPPDQA